MSEIIATPGAEAKPNQSPKASPPGVDVRPIRRLKPYYSYMVKMLKVVFPVVAISLVLLIVAWPYLQKQRLKFTVGFSTQEIIDKDEPTMINPRYTGVDEDLKPFSVTADIARNLVLDSTRVELEMPKADLTMSDGSWLLITAKQGLYNRTDQIIDLTGNVNVFHDQGYEIKTEAVRINFLTGTAESTVAVGGHGPVGEITAEGFRMNNKARIIHFTGKAMLQLYPDVMATQEKQ